VFELDCSFRLSLCPKHAHQFSKNSDELAVALGSCSEWQNELVEKIIEPGST
jgi:hypothetical protein